MKLYPALPFTPYSMTAELALANKPAGKLWGAGLEAMFPAGTAEVRPAPWEGMGRLKDRRAYDEKLVCQKLLAVLDDIDLIDPRTLFASQPAVTRGGVEYYMNNPAYFERGVTYEAGSKIGNRYPFIYLREDGERLILAGHHRSAAALLKGEQVAAIVTKGPWGPLWDKS